MNTTVWHEVISSIEETGTLYDEVNEVISFRRASKAREYAAQRLLETSPNLVLDSGAGPGSMSVLLLRNDPHVEVVALDYSSQLQRVCRKRLEDYRERVHFVRSCFEQLPFRTSSFDAAVTAYALRDSTNINQVISEYARSIKEDGRLAIAELGKPDNMVKRFFATVYVRFIMPLIAEMIVLGRLRSNPWRIIVPTYQNLPTTSKLLEMLEARFDLLQKKSFLAGGMLVILLRARSSSVP
jgi:demethylmenaquinone methyltransferase/2-methoxy-6-polyprenyl-1,4-benzoquinol methylase